MVFISKIFHRSYLINFVILNVLLEPLMLMVHNILCLERQKKTLSPDNNTHFSITLIINI